MNNTRDHQQLVDDLLTAFGSQPAVRVWIRVVGYDRRTQVRYGINGETDIQGIVAPQGRMLAIEVKTGSGKLSEDQRSWKNMVVKFGGIYIEARLGEDRDFEAAVQRAIDDFRRQL